MTGNFSTTPEIDDIMRKVKGNKSKFVRAAIKNMADGLPEHNIVVTQLNSGVITIEDLIEYHKNIGNLIKVRDV